MNRQKQFYTNSKNRLSDRDMLLDLMMTEKHLSHLYEHGVMEATSTTVGNTFERLQADTHDNARAIFTAMQQRGWYNPAQSSSGQRQQQFRPQKNLKNFAQGADSGYAVTSGSRTLGRRLSHGQGLGKSGIYQQQNNGSYHQPDWQ